MAVRLVGHALLQKSPMRLILFLALNPLAAALLGALFPGEPLGKRQLAALVLITSGLWLATRSRRLHQR